MTRVFTRPYKKPHTGLLPVLKLRERSYPIAMLVPDLPGGLISYGPNTNCTLDICPTKASVYGYRPSVAFNATFIAFFGICFMVHAFQLARYRAYFFSFAMISGCAAELIGYTGRLLLYQNPFSFSAFMANISTYSQTFSSFCADFDSLHNNCPCILLRGHLYNSWRPSEDPRSTTCTMLSPGLLLDVHPVRHLLTGHASNRGCQIFIFNRCRQVWCQHIDRWTLLPGSRYHGIHGAGGRLLHCFQTKGVTKSVAIGH